MTGKIKAMERGDPDKPGWVVVQGSIQTTDGRHRRQAWVRLAPDDYDRALRAHGQGLEVRMAGTLTRTGRRTELEPTEYFRVI